MEHEHWNTNTGNLIVQSSHVISGIDDQGLSKMSRSSSSSSSSSDSLLDVPFGVDDEEGRNTEIGNFMVQSSNDVGGVDIQVSSKMSRSFSSNSSSPDSPLDGSFWEDNEKHEQTGDGNLTIQSFPVVGEVDVQMCQKTSRSSSSSSSSIDSLVDGHFWDENEERRNTNGVNFMMQSSPTSDGLDVQTSSKLSRSSCSSYSSPESSFSGPFKEVDEKRSTTNSVNLVTQSSPAVDMIDVSNKMSISSSSSSSSLDSLSNCPFKEVDEKQSDTNCVNLVIQSSPAVDGLLFKSSSRMSRSSSSSSSSSSNSSLNGSSKEDSEGHRGTNPANLIIRSPPAVDGLDGKALSKMSRSSSLSSSSPDSSPNDPFKEDEEKHRKTKNENLVMQSSPPIDQVDIEVSSKHLRSSSSSSSSSSSTSSLPDCSLDDPFGKDDEKFDKSLQSTAFDGHNNEAEVEDRKSKEPASGNSLPTYELPIPMPPTEAKNHSPESSSGNRPTTDSPPTQVMERPTDSKYRIPSHVFARTKSNNPVEWSVTSNESLFSIHMGNMSFTGDQYFLKPEELATIPGESSTPGQIFNYSTNQSPGSQATDGKSDELAVETMKEVLKENEDQNHEKSIAEGRISHLSAGSAASTKSFAFPILTDLEKGHSVSIDGSSKLDRQPQQIELPKSSTPKTPSEALGQPKLNDPPIGTQFGFGIRWISCMPCCTFCR